MTYDISMGGSVRAGLLASGGSKTKVVDTLPPTGTPGQTIIVQTGPDFEYFIWNSQSNSWIKVVDNLYVTNYNGDDYETDASGPLTIGDFSSQNLWTRLEYHPRIYLNFAGGLPTIQGDGPAAAQNYAFLCGLIFRKLLVPDRTGLIEFEYQVSNYGDDTQIDANHGFELGAFIITKSITTYVSTGYDALLFGARRQSSYSPNGRYTMLRDLVGGFANDSIDRTANPGTSIANFKMYCIIDQRTAGISPNVWHYNTQTTLYAHNGGVYTNFIGAPGGATYANTQVLGKGLQILLGCKLIGQLYNAKTFGRFDWLTIHRGRLISW